MKRYFRENYSGIILFFVCSFIFFILFYLYHLPVEAVIYPFFICFFIVLIYFFKRYTYFLEKHKNLTLINSLDSNISENLSIYNNMIDEDYRKIISKLEKNIENLRLKDEEKLNEMMDYYTRWVHQIKTPISSISLIIQNDDGEVSKEISPEIFRIENYVNMALCYARLDSDTNDFVFEKTDLDSIIKESVRKYSKIFIKKRIILYYKETKINIVTDKKWLGFVLEQIISNALKYTDSGSISIGYENESLYVSDTGIGIQNQDIVRIFERGYTGFNGRMEKKSSGIGLYLCRKICDRMGYEILVNSKTGEGTRVEIALRQRDSIFE